MEWCAESKQKWISIRSIDNKTFYGCELDKKAEERKMKEYEDKERKRLLYEIEAL